MRVVPPTGPTNAKIVLVGEAPGKEEELRLKPFVGPAGRLLDRALHAAGINRSECYITNVVKVRPNGNDFSKVEDLGNWYRLLKQELIEVKPNVVVALGEQALRALTGRSGSTKWRGSVLHSSLVENQKVVCTEHPAYILPNRNPSDFHLLVFDLERALVESRTPEVATLHKEMLTNPSFEEVLWHLEEASHWPDLIIDVETNRETKSLLCIGISYKPDHALTIPYLNGEKFYWPVEQEVEIWRQLRKLLSNESIGKVGQNIAFDMNILYKYVGEVYPVLADTMLAHHLLHIEDPHSLAHITSIYTKHPYYKEDFKSWRVKGDVKMFYEYNCTDCIVTREAYTELHKELVEEQLDGFYYGYIMPLFRVLYRIEKFGVRVDEPMRVEMAKLAEVKIKELQEEVNKLVGYNLNVNSPKQMKEFLYDRLKLPVKRHAKTKRITADEKALSELNAKYPNPVFDRVLELRGKHKELGTYLEAKVDSDGRMRTSYSISGTDTGRLSSRKGVFGSGMDLQNVPESMRKPFIPDAGLTLVEFDLSQAENRVVAYLAGEERQIDIFERGGDFHSIMAEWLSKPRRVAKSIVHGTNYGMKKRLLSEITGLSQSEAEAVRMKYFETCPKVLHWHLAVQAQLKKTRTLVTPLGRRRTFYGMYGDDMFRKAYAFIPQSTVADWLNINLVALYYAIQGQGDILLQVHDSLLIQCNTQALQGIVEKARALLTRPIKIEDRYCRIPCDVKTGTNWGDMRGLTM